MLQNLPDGRMSMSLAELVPAVKTLPKAEYPIWTPLNAFEAAETLPKLLTE